MGVLRFFFKRHPKKPYKAPNYTAYQKQQTLKKYGKNPTPDRKVSRVNTPREKQDGLFSAMVDAIFKDKHNKNRGRGTGGRG